MGTKQETAYRSFAEEVSGLVDAVARLVIPIGRSVHAMTRLVRLLTRDETPQAKEETVFTGFGTRASSFADDVTRLVDAMASLVRLLMGEETTCAKQEPAVASLPDDRASFVNRLTSFATAVTSLLTAIATLVNWIGKRVRFWPSGVHGPLRLGRARKNEGAGLRRLGRARRSERTALRSDTRREASLTLRERSAWAAEQGSTNMGKASPLAVVLDAGALIAFERGDARMRALCREALRTRARLVIPAGVVAQVWLDGARQVPLRALLAGSTTEVPPLDRVLAEATGILCGRAGTSDIVDASVVLTARREGAVVVTSDPDDLHRLDPTLAVERI